MADDRRHVTRRTVARGAAWTAPAVIAGVAAPAFAASTTPPAIGALGVYQMQVSWGRGGFASNSFALVFTNPGTSDAIVVGLDMYSTYHAPADNATSGRVWSTAPRSPVFGTNGQVTGYSDTYTVPAGTAWYHFKQWEGVPGDTAWITPPMAGGKSLLPSYYVDFGPGDNDGKITCTPVRPAGDPWPTPDMATYPPNCKRLWDDNTYFVVRYTVEGVAMQLTYVPVNVPCTVSKTSGADCIP